MKWLAPLLAVLLGVAIALPTPGDPPPPETDGAPVPVVTADVPVRLDAPEVRPVVVAPPSSDPAPVVTVVDPANLPPTGRTLRDRTGRVFPASGLAHLDSALVHAGIRERPGNRGTEIDEWARGAGLNPGIAYCAAWIKNRLSVAGASCRDEAGTDVASALARTFTRDARYITAREVQIGREVVLPGDLPIWGFRRSTSGHIGMAVRDDRLVDPERMPYERPDGSCYETVEANTSCNGEGSARDGGGVCRRVRCGQTLGGMILLGYARPTYR